MSARYVTSFSEEGYKLYGKKFLESWVKYGPGELYVYYEDDTINIQFHPEIEDEKIVYKNLFSTEGCYGFLNYISKMPTFRGIMADGKRNYRFDVFTFCRKSFAQIDASLDFDGHLWWIDADVELVRDFPEAFFEEQLDGAFMAYLGRPGWHSCASLVGWDCAHEQNSLFWQNYLNLYVSGMIFTLPEWHDSFVLDALRTNLNLSSKDMAKNTPLGQGPVNVFDAVVGKWAKHKKGNKKFGPQRYQQLINLVQEKQPKRILEVGTWNGDRAIEMLGVSPESEYFGFDLFELATDETDETEKNVKPHHTCQSVGEKLTNFGIEAMLYAGNTKVTLGEYLKQEGENTADLIYIDGGHSVETIQSDYDYAKKIIKPGGVIVFDDYYEGMSNEDLEKWGANTVIKNDNFELLPIADPVKDGGFTKMAVVQC